MLTTTPPPPGLWAITTYFNPVGYRRRLSNYRVFRRRLGVPLLTVELAFDRDFELRDGDADRLIQRRGRDVMWHKERLLNVALEHLPDSCAQLLWIDADLVYTRPDWPAEVVRLLDAYPVIQAYRRTLYLARDASVECPTPAPDLRETYSFVSALAAGAATLDGLINLNSRASEMVMPGFAVAARRDVLERVGFYDACIIGGGDRAFLCAAYGRFDGEILSHRMNAPRAEHYLQWARPVFQAVGGQLGFLDADILHLWHGDLANRGNPQRHHRLAAFDFDPFVDLAITESGCWRWNSDKPAMHQFLRDYFAARQEDG